MLLLTCLALALWAGAFHILVIAAALCATLFCAASLYFGGLALRNPVAIKMDQNGISGYFVDPVRWNEIKEIKCCTGTRNRKYFGILLNDMAGHSPRQKRMRQLRSWLMRGVYIDFAISETTLKYGSVENLVSVAHRLQRQAR